MVRLVLRYLVGWLVAKQEFLEDEMESWHLNRLALSGMYIVLSLFLSAQTSPFFLKRYHELFLEGFCLSIVGNDERKAGEVQQHQYYTK